MGIIFYIKKKWEVSVEEINLDINQEFLFGGTRVKAIVIKNRIMLISVYGPAAVGNEDLVASFFEVL